MKGGRRSYFLILLVILLGLALSFFCAGCDSGGDDDREDESDDDDDDSQEDHLGQGKYWLQVGEGDKAREEFLMALSQEPGIVDGLYGMVLADMLHATDVVGVIVDYIKSLEYGGPVKSGDGDREKVDSSRGMINFMLDTVLNGLLLERCEEMVTYARTTQGIEGASFELEGIPIIIAFEHLADLNSEFDMGELYGSESYGLILKGLVGHLLTIDLDFDLSLAFILEDIDFGEMETMEAVSLVVDILYRIITDPAFPNFLTLYPDGIELYQQSGWELAMGLHAYLNTFAQIASETDDQGDDVMGYLDTNGNLAWDHGEPLYIPYFEVLEGIQMSRWAIITGVIEGYRNSLLDYTEYDIDPGASNPFRLALLNPLLETYGLPPVIPEETVLDLGSWYANPNPTVIRDTLIELLDFLRELLPPPPALD